MSKIEVLLDCAFDYLEEQKPSFLYGIVTLFQVIAWGAAIYFDTWLSYLAAGIYVFMIAASTWNFATGEETSPLEIDGELIFPKNGFAFYPLLATFFITTILSLLGVVILFAIGLVGLFS